MGGLYRGFGLDEACTGFHASHKLQRVLLGFITGLGTVFGFSERLHDLELQGSGLFKVYCCYIKGAGYDLGFAWAFLGLRVYMAERVYSIGFIGFGADKRFLYHFWWGL